MKSLISGLVITGGCERQVLMSCEIDSNVLYNCRGKYGTCASTEQTLRQYAETKSKQITSS